MSEGKLIWITGLAGSGKTTLSKKVYSKLRETRENVIHLDGDSLREILGGGFGYSIEDRIATAKIYSRMCKFLVEQGMIVIISTISLFHEIHEYNRENVENYYEVFLNVPKDVLLDRNQKKLYTTDKKQVGEVMGVHQEPEFPKNPDLVLQNKSFDEMEEGVTKILSLI